MSAPNAALDDYHARRDALMREDRSLRRENALVASDDTRRADAVLRAIRAREAETIWKDEGVSARNTFPGMGFLTGARLAALACAAG
jgi:adenosine deaminase CECR1